MSKKLLFLTYFTAVLGLVGNGFAKDIHVGPGLKDYTTIELGYAVATSGDTIIVHAGTYTVDQTGTYKTDDSIHDLTIKAATGENVVIDNGFGYIRYHEGWTIDGLIFNTNSVDSIVLYSGDNDDWTIKNCIFSNAGSQCIYVYDTANDNLTVENCTFYNNTSNDAIRIKRAGSGFAIKDCIFYYVRHFGDPSEHWVGKAISTSTHTGTICADYCTFWDCANDLGYEKDEYGTQCTSDHSSFGGPSVQPHFLSTDPTNAAFLYLSKGNDNIIKTGDSDGSYRGARPTPEPATVALLGLGGLALLRRSRRFLYRTSS